MSVIFDNLWLIVLHGDRHVFDTLGILIEHFNHFGHLFFTSRAIGCPKLTTTTLPACCIAPISTGFLCVKGEGFELCV